MTETYNEPLIIIDDINAHLCFFSLSLQSYYVSSRVIRLHELSDTERLHDVIINLNNKIICAYAIPTYLTNMNKC